MQRHSISVAWRLLPCGAFVLIGFCGCKERTSAESGGATTQPAAASTSPSPTPPPPEIEPPPEPIELPLSEAPPLQEGWLTIVQKAEPPQRAWVEGAVVGEDKLVIDTRNVRRFRLDLARIQLNWNRRIVLRIDGFNSELARRGRRHVEFLLTPSGAWTVVESE